MNKSKFKFLIGGVLTLNFLIYAEKSFAAIRKTFSGQSRTQRGNINPTRVQSSLSSVSSSSMIRPVVNRNEVESRLLRTPGAHRPQGEVRTLTPERIEQVITKTKQLVDDGNYIIIPKLKDTLSFMDYSEDNFKSDIKSLTPENFSKVRTTNVYRGCQYGFEKNGEESDKKLYVKFSMDKSDSNLTFVSYHNSDIKFEGAPDEQQDISQILNSPGFVKLDLLGRPVDKALTIAKQKIIDGDYQKIVRVKEGIRNLNYKMSDFREVIYLLDKKNFVIGPQPNYGASQDSSDAENFVWVFGYYDKRIRNDIYIKFAIDKNGDNLVFLSFHPTDRPLNYFFKDLQ